MLIIVVLELTGRRSSNSYCLFNSVKRDSPTNKEIPNDGRQEFYDRTFHTLLLLPAIIDCHTTQRGYVLEEQRPPP